MGKDLPVLLLDFSRSFSLLVPNIEAGKSFHSNNTSVEVLTKTLSSGQQITFMKFLFESPVITIEAPVLSDRQMMYKVLRQNSAGVLLECILVDVKKPEQQQVEFDQQQGDFVQSLIQGMNSAAPQQVVVSENSQVMIGDNFVVGVPKLPPGTVIVPQNGNVQLFEPPQPQYYEVYTDLMDAAFVQQTQQQQDFVTLPSQSALQQQQPIVTQESQAFIQAIGQPINPFSPTKVSVLSSSTLNASAPNVMPTSMDLQQPVSGKYTQQSPATAAVNDFRYPSSAVAIVTSPPNVVNRKSPTPSTVPASTVRPDFSHCAPASTQPLLMPGLPQQQAVVVPAAVAAQTQSLVQPEERVSRLIYADMITDSIYKCLKPDELKKIEFCRYCKKKFTFLSEHLVHMRVHTQDVESVSQMSINIWIQVLNLF